MPDYMDVKPGDRMILVRGEEAREVKVLRLTPTQIVIMNGDRFSRMDGSGRPSGTDFTPRASLRFTDDEHAVRRLDEARQYRAYRSALGALSDFHKDGETAEGYRDLVAKVERLGQAHGYTYEEQGA
jgi:hypothetical protein